jgi:hypothetical protein
MCGRRATAWTIVFALLAILASGCDSSQRRSATTAASTSASSLAPIHGRYSPSIDPANFVATVDNPLWPLEPGTGFHYKGMRGDVPQTDDEVVTHQTKQILGISATVVRDTVSQHGRPIERTLDFYAQDNHGNVWYLGEDSFELKNGRFAKASDSWRSGVDGAKPGIIMPADPQPGDRYRQEYYPPRRSTRRGARPRSPRARNGAVRHVQTVAGYERVQPVRAADGREVLRRRPRRDPGACGQGAPRGIFSS